MAQCPPPKYAPAYHILMFTEVAYLLVMKLIIKRNRLHIFDIILNEMLEVKRKNNFG